MRYRYETAKFDFSEADAISAHLAGMAAKGLFLDSTGAYLWRYRKGDPRTLRYAVGYLPGMHSAAPLPPEDLDAFRNLYEAAGWHFVTDWYFVQIFVTDDPDAVAPDTDERVKLEALCRSVGKQQRLNLISAGVMALLLVLLFLAVSRNPLALYATNSALAAPWLLTAACLSSLIPILRFQLWKRRARKALVDGGVCPPLRYRFRRTRNAVLWLVILLFAAAVIADACTSTGGGWQALRFLFWICGYGALVSLLNRVRRRSGNSGIYWAVFAIGFILFYVAYLSIPDGQEASQVSREALPLSIQDLGYSTDDAGFCRLTVSESVLLRRMTANDLADGYRLSYDVYQTSVDWVYDLCLQKAKQRSDWEPLAEGIWIYSYEYEEYVGASYLVVIPDTVLLLSPPDPLDEEQLETAISLLIP